MTRIDASHAVHSGGSPRTTAPAKISFRGLLDASAPAPTGPGGIGAAPPGAGGGEVAPNSPFIFTGDQAGEDVKEVFTASSSDGGRKGLGLGGGEDASPLDGALTSGLEPAGRTSISHALAGALRSLDPSGQDDVTQAEGFDRTGVFGRRERQDDTDHRHRLSPSVSAAGAGAGGEAPINALRPHDALSAHDARASHHKGEFGAARASVHRRSSGSPPGRTEAADAAQDVRLPSAHEAATAPELQGSMASNKVRARPAPAAPPLLQIREQAADAVVVLVNAAGLDAAQRADLRRQADEAATEFGVTIETLRFNRTAQVKTAPVAGGSHGARAD